MITACLSLYKTTGDEKFLDFSKKFLDYFVKDNGVIETYDPAEYNLDNVNQGKNLFTLYDLTGDQRYRDAIETIRGQLETQPRTKEGNSGTRRSIPTRSGWTALTWPSPSTWSMRHAATGCTAALTATSSS